MEKCKIKIINKSKYPLPEYQTEGSAGMDLYANIEKSVEVSTNEIILVPTGIYISLSPGYEAQIRARSGLALKHGISLVNGIGTIDSDYRGEIGVILTNLSKTSYTISPGERIAQMVIKKYILADWENVDYLDLTQRGENGYGHSGIKQE